MIANIIFGGIIPLILLVVAGYLLVVYRDERVIEFVRVAVTAAEQIYNGSGMGKEKFAYVFRSGNRAGTSHPGPASMRR